MPPKLPTNVRPQQLIKALHRLGFVDRKGRGSHLRLHHSDGRWTQVAIHNKPIPPGTIRAILRQTQLTAEELKKLL